MTDPQPGEGYTWPGTRTSAPTGPRQPLHDAPPQPAPVSPAGVGGGGGGGDQASHRGHPRRYGVAAGTVFAIVTAWLTIGEGVVLSKGLWILGAGVVLSAAATAIPRLRPFAQGFLAASVVVGIGSVGLLYLFLVTIFVAAVGS
jgi:hypothetical protein